VKPILTILISLFPLFLLGQVPGGKDMNTTNPPNLSWVDGRFEVLSLHEGTAFLRPMKYPLLSNRIEVKVSPEIVAEGLLKPKAVLWITIQKGTVTGAKL
jgi:hypothetical protein